MQTLATGATSLHEAFALLLDSSAWLAAGGFLGAFHFLTLRRSARMLTTGASLPAALALHLARFAVTAGALLLIARQGALPLLAATLGILAARGVVIRAALASRATASGEAG